MADTETLEREAGPPAVLSARRGRRRLQGRPVTLLAFALLLAALNLPNRPEQLSAGAWARIPLELVVLVALGVVLPPRARTVVATVLGLALAVVVLLKALDIGMLVGFYRTFDPLSDPSYAGSGYGVLRDSVGGVRAVLVAVALGVAALAALGLRRDHNRAASMMRP